MPETPFSNSHSSGFDSPIQTPRHSNTKPSPATSKFSTPPGPGYEAFSFMNAENKKVGRTPEGRHLIQLTGRQGRSHHHVRRHRDKSVICSSSSTISGKEEMWLILLAQLTDLKKRHDQDYDRKFKNKEIDRGHNEAAKILISSCIDLIKQCLLDEDEQTQRLKALNDGFLDGRIYNPYVVKNIYDGYDFHLELAKKFRQDPVQTLSLSIIQQPSGSKRKRDTDGDSSEDVPSSDDLTAKKPRPSNLPACALFKPRAVCIAPKKAPLTEANNTGVSTIL